jgi:hypothetical protein
VIVSKSVRLVTWLLLAAAVLFFVSMRLSSKAPATVQLRFLRYSNDPSGMRFAWFELSNGAPWRVESLGDYSRETDGLAESRGNSSGFLASNRILNPQDTESFAVPCPPTFERWRLAILCRKLPARKSAVDRFKDAMARYRVPLVAPSGPFPVSTAWIADPAD